MRRRMITSVALGTAIALVGGAGLARAGCGACAGDGKAEHAQAGHEHDHAHATRDVVETAVAAGDFTTLAKALRAAGLVDTLKGEGPFTVFAPTDEAFAKLPPGTLAELLADTERLTAVLTSHVVPGRLLAADVVKLRDAKTVEGQTVSIRVDGDTVTVDDAKVTKTDLLASNGVIHVIDTVIIPN